MLKIHGRLRVSVVTMLVLLIGCGATLFGFANSEASLRHSDDLLLVQDANQGALVLGSYVDSLFGAAPMTLGGTVTPIGVEPAVFAAAAAPLVKSGDNVALLHVVGDHLRVLDSVGTLHRTFGGPGDAELITILTEFPKNHFAGATVTKSVRYLEQIYGAGTVPSGFAIYTEQPDGIPASGVFSVPGSLFTGINAAVYVGSVGPSNLVFSTTREATFTGDQAVAPILAGGDLSDAKLTSKPGSFVSPGQLVVVLAPKGNLSGGSSAAFPWVLLVVGLLATTAVAWFTTLALYRRNQALALVRDLKINNAELDTKNAELDEALSRQADAEKGLRQAQRMEAVGQLAGGIAHDFNNLLHVIISYGGFLAESVGEDPSVQADLAEIQKAAHRAAELTRQLLIFSRKDVTRPKVLDLNAVISDTERLLHRTLGEDVALTCETSDAPCFVLADPGELDQVLMNLCLNARDAMPRGGHLSVKVQEVEPSSDEVPTTERYARIDVTDDGQGMAPDVVAKAFEPFFTTKDTGRGTGLGLAMVYGIMGRWGGHALIRSQLGIGTTVSLFFPLTHEASESQAEARDNRPTTSEHGTVLLVEDEEVVLRSTSRVLESCGYRVVEARNALDAMEAFNTNPIDILVTDVIMPGGVSGVELADRLRETKPNLPVVFVSGYSAETIAERGVLSPATLLVTKPFSPGELVDAIANAKSATVEVRQ